MKKFFNRLLMVLVLVVLGTAILAAGLHMYILQSQPDTPVPEPTEPTTETTRPTEGTEPTPPVTEAPLPEITWMTFPEDRQITAKQYFVYDVQAKAFLTISGDPEETVYPASVTKLFTCYVALQYLKPDQVLTVGEELEKVVKYSSVAQLRQGDQLTVSQLVAGMLLPSGNDAAYVLAINAGRAIRDRADISVDDALAVFMSEMKEQAQEVGMIGANFANPDGIHREEHFMTFSDLAVLGSLSVENPIILEYAGTSHMLVEFIQEGAAVGENLREEGLLWKNTNALIDPDSDYYCPCAIGLKTGQTPYAGSCLLSAFTYEDRTYVVGVFGCPDSDSRFQDTLQLFNQIIP